MTLRPGSVKWAAILTPEHISGIRLYIYLYAFVYKTNKDHISHPFHSNLVNKFAVDIAQNGELITQIKNH